MTEAELQARINAMAEEYRTAILGHVERSVQQAVQIAMLKAELEAAKNPKSADVIPIKPEEKPVG